MQMHFNGIPLKAPDHVDWFLAPAMIVGVTALIVLAAGSGAWSWSLSGAFAGGVISRVVGIRVQSSVKETLAAGVFGAFGGFAALTAFWLLP